jgi:hypothetical protein
MFGVVGNALDLFDSKLLCHAVTDMTFVRFACR